jgi:hypothetical protein
MKNLNFTNSCTINIDWVEFYLFLFALLLELIVLQSIFHSRVMGLYSSNCRRFFVCRACSYWHFTEITYVAAIVNNMAPQFIRVLQSELSFDNNILLLTITSWKHPRFGLQNVVPKLDSVFFYVIFLIVIVNMIVLNFWERLTLVAGILIIFVLTDTSQKLHM